MQEPTVMMPSTVFFSNLRPEAEPFEPPPMKHSDTRDSISSIDSDISLTFDHNAEEGAHLADMSDCGSDAAESTPSAGSPSAATKEEPAKDEPPFVPPDDELAQKIVAQVEFYFSDVNITKDAFLLKHVKRNKEGYVSLKLISSFKRVKHLARDWRSVAYALERYSTKLQINEAGTKLRRVDPLPAYDETAPSRTVVAAHLPPDRPTIEGVADLFSSYGDIALVRIVRPGNPVPQDARAFLARHPELAGTVCALVEFTTTESAHRALAGWRARTSGVAVHELVSHDANNNTTTAGGQQQQPPRKKSSVSSGPYHRKSVVTRLVTSDYSSSCSEAETEPRPPPSNPHNIPVAPLVQAVSAAIRSTAGAATIVAAKDRQVTRARTAPELCPWVAQRRESDFRPRSNSGVTHLPDNVLRMPRGPDGGRGFASRPRPLVCAS
ncbi:la-related protein 6 [Schistocerca cancellata]|uniref:la-related protein 6 n=1 Tax=Schistocerca cancellata TaxID=274614 RepID=UPI0021183B26|nr:la-related protein 6 [Schistocerca cancellata]